MSDGRANNGRKPWLAVPEGFAEAAETHTVSQLRRMFGLGYSSCHKLIASLGMKPYRVLTDEQCVAHRVSLPSDFMAHAHQSNRWLAQHYGRNEATIRRFRRETGTSSPKRAPRPNRPMPDDFKAIAATLTLSAAEDRWNAGSSSVRRWYLEAGLSPKKQVQRVTNRNKQFSGITPPDNRPWSLVEDAARHLRTERWIVNRVKTGDPRAPEDLWWVGSRKLTEDQMLEFAAKKGWQNPLGRLAA